MGRSSIMSHEIAAMSFSRNHSRQERCSPGCGDTRGTQSGCALRNASSPLRTTTTSPGSTFTPARAATSSSSFGVTGLPTVT